MVMCLCLPSRKSCAPEKEREDAIEGGRMGKRRRILVGLALAMLMGFAVYFRLWALDYTISSDEMDLIRKQFDLANKEAMDESAEWRLKYDEEVERTVKCEKELLEVKQSFEKLEDAASINTELEMLRKENVGLLERVESLKQELEAEKLKCSMR
ncbi:uncharacterized protein LOC131168594 [Malania oleifera]|uniref:uncharacterized protein LOC131168594 n=1 Tax=Malania oleifera TaxID=397392 RepID=UPI0025AE6DB3|nr:uncharacterized protein LOC131168594 [Malania oleifera]